MSDLCAHGRKGYERCPWCDPWRDPLPSTAQTRAEAEIAIQPSAANLREQVLECVRANPQGVTDEKICDLTGMQGNTERPRRRELEKAGRIMASGSAKTRSGRTAVTWVAS